jgi:hypothetical protein
MNFTQENVSKSIDAFITKIGSDKISTIITDSASNMVSAKEILKQKYNKIIFLPCAAHCLNLVLGDIVLSSGITKNVFDASILICKFFKFRQLPNERLEGLRDRERDGRKIPPRLGLYCDTRWDSSKKMINGLLMNRALLGEMVHDPEFLNWSLSNDYKTMAQKVKRIILNNHFWERLHSVNQVFEPICDLLREVQGDKCPLSRLYAETKRIQTLFVVNTSKNPIFAKAAGIMQHRCVGGFVRPEHGLVYLMDPFYAGKMLSLNEENQFLSYAEK